MRLIEPSIKIESEINGDYIIKFIEKSGRVCYKSEDKINDDSAKIFIKTILDSGHESVIEHYNITVRIICDRGVTHEIVRHRIASYSQESTRYCNYSNNKYGNELTFINPCFWNNESPDNIEKKNILIETLLQIEKNYKELIKIGATPQEARAILPNCLKTEMVMTANLREWRHFLKLRASKNAHPQMRQIALMILKEFKERIPIVFDDISEN